LKSGNKTRFLILKEGDKEKLFIFIHWYMHIQLIDNDDQKINSCFSIMKQLVPSINKNDFLDQVKRKYKYGYKLVVLEVDNKVLSLAGIRFYEYFGCGKFLIIDDLVTKKDFRGKGYGKRIFEWIKSYARKNGCSEIQLDSNINLFKAHKFYMNMGMNISHHHFSLVLG
jgi:GNAT superfamily N-acetyltransferase